LQVKVTAPASWRAQAVPCEALGVSFYTVRAHLARIFGKTGTQRQAELVALLTRLSGHLRAMD
jgi:hypothetical protein